MILERHLPNALFPVIMIGGVLACSEASEVEGPDTEEPCAAAGDMSVVIAPDGPSYIDASGETVTIDASVVDSCDEPVSGVEIEWATTTPTVATVEAGVVTGTRAGHARIVASADGGSPDTTSVYVLEHGPHGELREVGLGLIEPVRHMRDLWAYGDFALSGSSNIVESCGSASTVPPCPEAPLVVWDLGDPAAPQVVDTIDLDAQINDVKISADGTLAVAGLQSPGEGIAVLDVADPADIEVLAVHTDGLREIHNLWIEEIDGAHYVFVTDHELAVLDLSSPAEPVEVARFDARGSSKMHDVYVRDGLAFLSYWHDGLIILDVGNGIEGGRPDAPVEVGRIEMPGGETHNAWYWPDAGYVFVGTEDWQFPFEEPGEFGRVFVVDVADLAAPEIVATYTVGQIPPHNFWVDEDEAILFIAHYDHGLRAVDVSGRLEGELIEQDRELASIMTVGPEEPSRFWGPQLHDGFIYTSDTPHGIR
ncbi:MAG: hypothetical protein ACOC8B_01785, partial [Gemmatimonadota bacterium]